MADQIGVYHFADNAQLFDVQRNNAFEFVVTGLDNLLRAGAVGNESNAYIANAQDVLRLSVVGAPIPHFTQEEVEIKRGNSTLYYAGVPTFSEGTLTFNDFVGADTKSALMAWQNLSYNVKNQTVGSVADPATNYKKDCYLIEYTPDFKPVRTWRLYGCWIKGLQEGDYSYEDGGKHQITATVRYDRAEIDLSSNN